MCIHLSKSCQWFLSVFSDQHLTPKGLKFGSHYLVTCSAIAKAKYSQARCEFLKGWAGLCVWRGNCWINISATSDWRQICCRLAVKWRIEKWCQLDQNYSLHSFVTDYFVAICKPTICRPELASRWVNWDLLGWSVKMIASIYWFAKTQLGMCSLYDYQQLL